MPKKRGQFCRMRSVPKAVVAELRAAAREFGFSQQASIEAVLSSRPLDESVESGLQRLAHGDPLEGGDVSVAVHLPDDIKRELEVVAKRLGLFLGDAGRLALVGNSGRMRVAIHDGFAAKMEQVAP